MTLTRADLDHAAATLRAWVTAMEALPEDQWVTLSERQMALNLAQQLPGWADRLDLPAVSVETEIRAVVLANGEHRYLSTYCVDGDHGNCRESCMQCKAPCVCSCGHPKVIEGEQQ